MVWGILHTLPVATEETKHRIQETRLEDGRDEMEAWTHSLTQGGFDILHIAKLKHIGSFQSSIMTFHKGMSYFKLRLKWIMSQSFFFSLKKKVN